jgi:ATP synthase I chain
MLTADPLDGKVDPPPAGAEHFYSGASGRIGRFMRLLVPLLVPAGWWKFGLRAAIGLVCGCAIAYLNFYWLERVIAAFVDRASGTGAAGSGQGIVFRFLLRYVLMAIGAYAILTVSPASLKGLLAGLFLPVAAIVCEAVYEVYVALVRGL